MSRASVVSIFPVEPSPCGYCKGQRAATAAAGAASDDDGDHACGELDAVPQAHLVARPADDATATSAAAAAQADAAGAEASAESAEEDGVSRPQDGLWAHSLAPIEYQVLLDRSWRRSGSYLYRPHVGPALCCALYTIRHEPAAFVPSTSQARALRRFRQWLAGERDDDGKRAAAVASRKRSRVAPQPGAGPDPTRPPPKKAKLLRMERKQAKAYARAGAGAEGGLSDAPRDAAVAGAVVDVASAAAGAARDAMSVDAAGAIAAAAAAPASLPAERVSFATAPAPALASTADPSAVTGTAAAVAAAPVAARHVELAFVPISEIQASLDESFALYKSYQTIVHGDTPEKLTPRRFADFLARAPFPEAKPVARLAAFACAGVHGIRVTRWPQTFGAYHLQWRLDGALVAVSVLDVLPGCLSSVYFFYTPRLAALRLGVVSALVELALAGALQAAVPSLRGYYMGFFVQTCAKMRYKGTFKPYHLLCPTTREWVPGDAAHLAVMSKSPVLAAGCAGVSASADAGAGAGAGAGAAAGAGAGAAAGAALPAARDAKSVTSKELEAVPLLIEGRPLQLSVLRMLDRAFAAQLEAKMRTYILAVGPELSSRLAVYESLPTPATAAK